MSFSGHRRCRTRRCLLKEKHILQLVKTWAEELPASAHTPFSWLPAVPQYPHPGRLTQVGHPEPLYSEHGHLFQVPQSHGARLDITGTAARSHGARLHRAPFLGNVRQSDGALSCRSRVANANDGLRSLGCIQVSTPIGTVRAPHLIVALPTLTVDSTRVRDTEWRQGAGRAVASCRGRAQLARPSSTKTERACRTRDP